jgi:hypothetical protein
MLMIGRGLGVCIGSRLEGDIDNRLIHGREIKTRARIVNTEFSRGRGEERRQEEFRMGNIYIYTQVIHEG